MDVTGTASDLARFDPATWADLVRAVVGDDDAELVSHAVEPIFIGIGTGTRLYRVTGTASTTPPMDWSLVIKVFTTEHLDFQSVSEDETAWDYWKREWQVYRSSWLPELDGPLIAPRCLGSGELTGENGPLAWVALEDLGHLPHRWPLAEFEDVASALGRFGGRYLAGATIPDEPWLAKHWLTGWTEQAAATIDLLPVAAQHPDASRVFPREVGQSFRRLWDHRASVLAALDELPSTFTHNDVFPRNLRRRSVGGSTGGVAIDWAYCGRAPVGAELAPLIGASTALLGCPRSDWEELEHRSLAAYERGLRLSGWTGSTAEIRFGYLASVVLRYALGTLTPILGLTLSPDDRAMVPLVFGCDFEEFVINTGAVTRMLHARVAEVLATAGI